MFRDGRLIFTPARYCRRRRFAADAAAAAADARWLDATPLRCCLRVVLRYGCRFHATIDTPAVTRVKVGIGYAAMYADTLWRLCALRLLCCCALMAVITGWHTPIAEQEDVTT